jgi:hypothetical protein
MKNLYFCVGSSRFTIIKSKNYPSNVFLPLDLNSVSRYIFSLVSMIPKQETLPCPAKHVEIAFLQTLVWHLQPKLAGLLSTRYLRHHNVKPRLCQLSTAPTKHSTFNPTSQVANLDAKPTICQVIRVKICLRQKTRTRRNLFTNPQFKPPRWSVQIRTRQARSSNPLSKYLQKLSGLSKMRSLSSARRIWSSGVLSTPLLLLSTHFQDCHQSQTLITSSLLPF